MTTVWKPEWIAKIHLIKPTDVENTQMIWEHTSEYMMASYSVAADWRIEIFSAEYFALPAASSNARFAQGRYHIFHRKELYHRGEWARQAHDVCTSVVRESAQDVAGCHLGQMNTTISRARWPRQKTMPPNPQAHMAPATLQSARQLAGCTLPHLSHVGGKNPTAGSFQSHGAPGSLALLPEQAALGKPGLF